MSKHAGLFVCLFHCFTVSLSGHLFAYLAQAPNADGSFTFSIQLDSLGSNGLGQNNDTSFLMGWASPALTMSESHVFDKNRGHFIMFSTGTAFDRAAGGKAVGVFF